MLLAQSISYDHHGETLFENLSISLDSSAKKRVAIVGKNGCGKSTLLKLLSNELQPTSGSINLSKEIIGYLKQEPNFGDETQTIEHFLTSKLEEDWMTYKISMVLEEVSLPDEIQTQTLNSLSGGQRVRLALAEILLLEPTILLLDEPTNHLDQDSIDWLISFTKNFNGTVAFVSHDRYFINKTANQIWEITPEKSIENYCTNYDQFLIERYKRYQKRLTEFELSQREVNELKEWLKANANHPKYKFTATVAQRKKALERMETKAPPEPVTDPRVKIQNLEPNEKGTILTAHIESKQIAEKNILNKVTLKLHSGERLLISGPNGSGKSTLLKIIAGLDKDFQGKITYKQNLKIGFLQQFVNLDLTETVIDEFSSKTKIDYTLCRSILSKYLFPAAFMEDKIKNLSFGQQRRLELAILLTQKPDLLILDEPTNHLDIFLREDLEQFLIAQNIAMLIVSHDTWFTQKLNLTHKLHLT